MALRSPWLRLLTALLLSAAALGSLYLVIQIYPNRPGKTPRLPPDSYASLTPPSGEAAADPSLPFSPARELAPQSLLQTGLLHPWTDAEMEHGPGPLRLRGFFLLRGYPSADHRLRLAGPAMNRFRLDLWHGPQGVRLERAEDGTLRGHRLQSDGVAPIPPAALLRDARFYRQRTLARLDGPIAFKWGRDPPFSGMDADHFAVRWTGFFHVPREGMHTFHLRADDGARLFVNGSLVADAWTGRSMQWVQGRLFLVRGWHGLVLEYYERTLDAGVHLQWERPDKWRSEIPLAWTTPAADDTPDWLTRLKPAAVDPYDDPDKQGLLGIYHWGPIRSPPWPEPRAVELHAQAPWPWETSGPFAFDLLHQQGHIVLRRGEGALLRVPLKEPPTCGLLEIDGRVEVLQLLAEDSVASGSR